MTAKVRSNFAASKLNKKLFKLMLNANSISVAQSVKFNEIFTDSAKTINDTVIGQIFLRRKFRKGMGQYICAAFFSPYWICR